MKYRKKIIFFIKIKFIIGFSNLFVHSCWSIYFHFIVWFWAKSKYFWIVLKLLWKDFEIKKRNKKETNKRNRRKNLPPLHVWPEGLAPPFPRPRPNPARAASQQRRGPISPAQTRAPSHLPSLTSGPRPSAGFISFLSPWVSRTRSGANPIPFSPGFLALEPNRSSYKNRDLPRCHFSHPGGSGMP